MEKVSSQGGQTKCCSGHEGKTLIDVRLRDGRSGELLGKAHVEFDENAKKPEKYDETVTLKDTFGNEIGSAVLEIEQRKPISGGNLAIDDEFRNMRKEVGHMMRETNKIFDNFSRRYYGRDWGNGLLDDFRPMLMFDEPWMRDETQAIGSSGSQTQEPGRIDVEKPMEKKSETKWNQEKGQARDKDRFEVETEKPAVGQSMSGKQAKV